MAGPGDPHTLMSQRGPARSTRVGLLPGATLGLADLPMLMPPPVPVPKCVGITGRSMDGMDGIERAFVSLAFLSLLVLVAGMVALAML